MAEFGWVHELAGAYKHLPSPLDLLYALGCEWNFRLACASPIDRPFGLA